MNASRARSAVLGGPAWRPPHPAKPAPRAAQTRGPEAAPRGAPWAARPRPRPPPPDPQDAPGCRAARASRHASSIESPGIHGTIRSRAIEPTAVGQHRSAQSGFPSQRLGQLHGYHIGADLPDGLPPPRARRGGRSWNDGMPTRFRHCARSVIGCGPTPSCRPPRPGLPGPAGSRAREADRRRGCEASGHTPRVSARPGCSPVVPAEARRVNSTKTPRSRSSSTPGHLRRTIRSLHLPRWPDDLDLRLQATLDVARKLVHAGVVIHRHAEPEVGMRVNLDGSQGALDTAALSPWSAPARPSCARACGCPRRATGRRPGSSPKPRSKPGTRYADPPRSPA